MSHEKISFLNKGAKYSGLSLSDSNFLVEIVAIHKSEFVHDKLDGELIKREIRQFPLGKDFLHDLDSFLNGVKA